MNTTGPVSTPSLIDRKSKLVLYIYDATETQVKELEDFLLKNKSNEHEIPQIWFNPD